jgi:hypothetical protein
MKHLIQFIALLMLLSLTGCSSLVSSATSRFANNLSNAFTDNDDLETVESGTAAYLLLIDSLIAGDPKNENLLLAGSKLYGAYSTVFVTDTERAKRLSKKARDYSDRALCVHEAKLCNLLEQPFADFTANIRTLKVDEVALLFTSGAAWASWLQANSSDWDAVANMAKVQAAMERAVELDETYSHGQGHVYLAVFDTILPPALGGKPEEGRVHFERAIKISAGKDLIAKVEFARRYARITYDRPLHDRILQEVLDANPVAPGLTLSNMLAKRQARELLASADKYF